MSGYFDLGGSPYSQSMAGFEARSETATRDIMPARRILASRARILDMSVPTARAAVDRLKAGIVGSGLTYSTTSTPRFLDPDLYDVLSPALSKRLSIVSATHALDAQRRLTFSQMQVLACRSWLLTGDVFLVRRPGGAYCSWRIVEGDRCCTPYWMLPGEPYTDGSINPDTGNRVIDGVELDDNACPVAYWFIRRYCDMLAVDREAWSRVDAHDAAGLPFVIHLFRPERPDQYRGVPLLSPVIEKIWSMQSYSKAELQSAILESCYALFIRSNAAPTDSMWWGPTQEELDRALIPKTPEEKKAAAEKDAAAHPDMYLSPTASSADVQCGVSAYEMPVDYLPDYRRPMRPIGPGETRRLQEGEDIVQVDPKRPASGYSDFMSFGYREVGAAVGVSHNVIEGSYEGMTYAASRGAIIEAARTYKEMRGFFIESFMRPIIEIFAYDMIYNAPGLQDALGDIDPFFAASAMSLDAVWNAPVSVCLDPKAELDAADLAIRMGLIDRDEAAQAIYGHPAKGAPLTEGV